MTSIEDRLARIRREHMIREHPRNMGIALNSKDAELRNVNHYARAIQEQQAHLEHAVARARMEGASWAAIGDELGISKQAAHQRYGLVDNES